MATVRATLGTMARFKDEPVKAALEAQLQPGEQLQYYAFGVKQPNMGLIILLVCLAILPGLIAVAVLTKEYVIGLTDRRLIVLRVGGGVKVKEVSEYALGDMRGVKTSTGSLFTHIAIGGPVPFTAKFHRMGMKTNREQAMAIASVLTSKALPA